MWHLHWNPPKVLTHSWWQPCASVAHSSNSATSHKRQPRRQLQTLSDRTATEMTDYVSLTYLLAESGLVCCRTYSKEFVELRNVLPFLSVPLEVGFLNPATGPEEHWKLPQRSLGGRTPAKIELVHCSLKIWHLVTRFLMICFFDCTILHIGLHILLSGLDKIGWTAWLKYALVCSVVFVFFSVIAGRTIGQTSVNGEIAFIPMWVVKIRDRRHWVKNHIATLEV